MIGDHLEFKVEHRRHDETEVSKIHGKNILLR